MKTLPTRQVHLDFHTSPLIEDLLEDFDAERFADTLEKAHVNSVTIFAKCHHGMSYYPTEVGTPHPYLQNRDLLGDMLTALHARGIRAPIYYTVGWEEHLAYAKPEWRQLKADSTFARVEREAKDGLGGGWWFMSFLHPEYLAHMKREVAELCERYKVDGLFFDICFYHPEAGFGEAVQPIRDEHGLSTSPQHQREFLSLAKQLFAAEMTPLVQNQHPDASCFYNSAHQFSVDASRSVRAMNAQQSHWEIESLPSGFWGYYHFPRFARHTETFSVPWLGMTGRFQRMWGDFGGLKPRAALEFECYRTQAHGGANSVGDQLPPRGRLEQGAYDLIGAVYAQVEAAEPFYQDTEPVFDSAILLASHASVPAEQGSLSEEGAVLMLEEAHYHPAVLDDSSDLSNYPVLLLPDSTVITKTLYDKLKSYYEAGGKLILSYRAGFGTEGNWKLNFLPLNFHGDLDMTPTYWRFSEAFWPDKRGDFVFYDAGLNVSGGDEILVERVLPYFKRSDTQFMSHFQAPPVKEAYTYPAVVAGERFVYFADPVFRSYRSYGATLYRDVLERVLHRLVGPPKVGAGLPRTVLSLPRRHGDDLRLTLLHYVPLRKALEGDVLEEAMSFAGETLRVAGTAVPRLFGGQELAGSAAEGFRLPTVKGRLLLELPGYFS